MGAEKNYYSEREPPSFIGFLFNRLGLLLDASRRPILEWCMGDEFEELKQKSIERSLPEEDTEELSDVVKENIDYLVNRTEHHNNPATEREDHQVMESEISVIVDKATGKIYSPLEKRTEPVTVATVHYEIRSSHETNQEFHLFGKFNGWYVPLKVDYKDTDVSEEAAAVLEKSLLKVCKLNRKQEIKDKVDKIFRVLPYFLLRQAFDEIKAGKSALDCSSLNRYKGISYLKASAPTTIENNLS